MYALPRIPYPSRSPWCLVGGKVRHIEGGRNVVKKSELSALVQLYQADDRLPALDEVRRQASKPGWWSTAKLPPHMQTYVGAETEARRMGVFTVELIPGLPRIEEYTRNLNAIVGITDVDEIVAVRAPRQRRLVDAKIHSPWPRYPSNTGAVAVSGQ